MNQPVIRCSNKDCRRMFFPKVLLARELSIPHRDKKAVYYCVHCNATSTTGRIWRRTCTECGGKVDAGNLYPANGEPMHCLCFKCKQKINPSPQHQAAEEKPSYGTICFRCERPKNLCRSC